MQNSTPKGSNKDSEMEQLGSYDVVFDGNLSSKTVHSGFTRHVGNARFLVFISIYSETFIDALRHGDIKKCHEIVSEIIDTICYKVSPKGRFFAYTEDNLQELGDGKKVHDIIFRKICRIKRKELSPIEQARLGKAVKIAEQREKAIDLNDRRFMLSEELSRQCPRAIVKSTRVDLKKHIGATSLNYFHYGLRM